MGESDSGIRALADFIRDVTKYQQAFWRRYQGTIATLSMDSACPRIFSFYFRLPLPLLPMEQPSLSRLSNPKGEFWKPSSSPNPFLTASGEPHPAFKAMVQTQLFSGTINEDPSDHLRVFEGLCSSLVIPGMTQEAVRWKLLLTAIISHFDRQLLENK